MTIEVDRSRIIAYQTCPRLRYLAYHHLGKGLQRRAKALPLVVGSAFHEGAEELLAGDIETAVYRAMKYLSEAFKGKGVGLDGEDEKPTDESMAYSAQEQVALTEGMIRAWGLERLPEFLEQFEVLETEQEGRADLTEGLTLLFRPDALVRDKLSGDLYIISWKTAATYNKRTLQQAKTDMQSMSEVFGVEQERGKKVEGVIYLPVIKGRRTKDNWDGLYKQGSHLIYGWVKLDTLKTEFPEWSWSYSWPKEDGQGESRLGKGWQKRAVWSDYPGGVKQWIEDLHNRQVFPRHVDPFEGLFPQSLPIERRADEVERWRRQVVAQEERIAATAAMLESCNGDVADRLDMAFPQYSHSCFSYSGCQFIPICHEGVMAEEGELYQIRQSNHPEKGDDNG